ncbi:MAG: four helix bundle protein [Patescibacteria group bacterium]
MNKPTFEKLRIWQEAYQLMLEVHTITKTLPREEKFKLADQAERSSGSVPDAIAEGYSTYYYNDKIKSFYLARREAGETQNHLRKMEGKRYLATTKSQELVDRYEGLIKGINAYIRYIREKQQNEKQ